MNDNTVRVMAVPGHPCAIWLQWDAKINPDHIPPAFDQLNTGLDSAEHPVHVLVDLRQNPTLPLAITMHEALSGPFTHPRMGIWLVIGSNQRAQIVANVITKAGFRKNIQWFETEEDAFARLEELESVTSTS